MFRTALLATTALVLGTSLAVAGGMKGPMKQPQHKGLIATVKHNGVANQGMVLNTKKGAIHNNHLPAYFPTTYSNLSKDANAQFVSWYGFYASNSCFSYYGSSNYHYDECFYENSAVPVTGTGLTAKKIYVPIYNFFGNSFTAGVYSDSGGQPGALIHGGSATGGSTSYCCTTLQTVSIHKTVLAAGTPYWVEVTSNAGAGLWLTEDTDYSTGQPYDFHYGAFGTYNFGSGTQSFSSNSGWLASTANPFRPAVRL